MWVRLPLSPRGRLVGRPGAKYYDLYARSSVGRTTVSKTADVSSILTGYAMLVAQLARAYGYGHRVGGSSPPRHSQRLREEAPLGGDSFSVIASRRRRLHAMLHGNN